MVRYADPSVCPGCRAPLSANPEACPACGLPLRGQSVAILFRTLQSVDQQVAAIRASAEAAPAPTAYPAEPLPRPHDPVPDPSPRRTGVRGSSVPKILLTLGALCLLVAAAVFLAVAWSFLGVGGRTAVLVVLTLLTGGLGTWLGRRGLRIAAESLTLVALGLLTLDVLGAQNAGWLGDLSTSGSVCTLGVVLLLVSLLLVLPAAPAHALVGPQVVGCLGLGLAVAVANDLTDHHQVLAAGAVVAFAGVAAAGRLRTLPVLAWVAGAGAAIWWIILALLGLADAGEHATVRGLWLEGHGVGMLAASALLLLPIAFARTRPAVVQASGAAAASLLTLTLALPGLDDGGTRLALVSLTAVALWSLVVLLGPARWALVPRVPLALSAVPLVGVVFGLLLDAGGNVLGDLGDPFTRGADVALHPGTPLADPAVLVPAVVGLLLAAAVLAPSVRPLWPAGGAVLAFAGIATLGLYPLPLAVVVAALALGGLLLVGAALRRTDVLGTGAAVAGTVVVLLATATALPSAVLTTATTAVLVLLAAAVTTRGRFPWAAYVGWPVVPAALAGLLWSAAEVADVDQAFRGAPVLLVVGILAILQPRLEAEVAAALSGLLAGSAAVAAAADESVSLALHLTLAGALVVASSLVNPSRRRLGWAGGLLLAGATWVRLADLGVHAPEAYTLPTAAALLLVGLDRLRRDPGSATLFALGPALTLATVPSLLWVLAGDVVTWRAALLGLGCLVLVLAGTVLRWNAPLVVGATAGGLLVLRELAPYVAATPPWILIGLAGIVLTIVGVTWEKRMLEVRNAGAYLARLR